MQAVVEQLFAFTLRSRLESVNPGVVPDCPAVPALIVISPANETIVDAVTEVPVIMMLFPVKSPVAVVETAIPLDKPAPVSVKVPPVELIGAPISIAVFAPVPVPYKDILPAAFNPVYVPLLGGEPAELTVNAVGVVV